MTNVEFDTYITRQYGDRFIKIYCDLLNDKRARKIKSYLPGYIFPLSHKIWIYLISNFKWQTIIDVGANYGEFTCDADFYSKKYYPLIQSFEPAKKTFNYLMKTRNELNPNIQIYNIGISDFEGQIMFKENIFSSGSNKIMNEDTYALTEDIFYEVSCMKLEKFIGTNTSALVKIDTEGNELKILSSLSDQIIQAKKICFFIEINQIDFVGLLNLNSNISLFLFNKWTGKFVKVKHLKQKYSKYIYYEHDGILSNSEEVDALILTFKIRFIERLKWVLFGHKNVV